MQKIIFTLRRKLILSIILLALAAICIFGFTACSDDVTEDDLIARGYTVAVIYDFQGGTVDKNESVKIRVKENSLLPEPRNSGGGIGIPSKQGYSFRGFFLALTDEDGNVVLDENGNATPSDKQWDFAKDTVESADITLCAGWWDNFTVNVRYGEGYTQLKQVELARTTAGDPVVLRETACAVNDYTFLSYHLEKDDDASAIKFPYTFNAAAFGDGLTTDIWVKSLDGVYVLVNSARDLSISTVGVDTNYYIMADIDMDGAEYNDETSSIKLPKSYSGKFIGNGHSISNFTLNLSALDKTYTDFGMFRSIDAGAEITDVIFKDVTVNCSLSDSTVQSYNVGMLAGQVSAGAKVSGIEIVNSEVNKTTLAYKVGVNVTNESINIADDLFVGRIADGAEVDIKLGEDSNIDFVRSTAVYCSTADDDFAIYFTYTDRDGVITLGDDAIYALATKSQTSGTYSNKTIKTVESVGTNSYKLTRINNASYLITITVADNDFSATISDI